MPAVDGLGRACSNSFAGQKGAVSRAPRKRSCRKGHRLPGKGRPGLAERAQMFHLPPRRNDRLGAGRSENARLECRRREAGGDNKVDARPIHPRSFQTHRSAGRRPDRGNNHIVVLQGWIYQSVRRCGDLGPEAGSHRPDGASSRSTARSPRSGRSTESSTATTSP